VETDKELEMSELHEIQAERHKEILLLEEKVKKAKKLRTRVLVDLSVDEAYVLLANRREELELLNI